MLLNIYLALGVLKGIFPSFDFMGVLCKRVFYEVHLTFWWATTLNVPTSSESALKICFPSFDFMGVL